MRGKCSNLVEGTQQDVFEQLVAFALTPEYETMSKLLDDLVVTRGAAERREKHSYRAA